MTKTKRSNGGGVEKWQKRKVVGGGLEGGKNEREGLKDGKDEERGGRGIELKVT